MEPTRVKHLLGAPLLGMLLALPANKLGWKGLPITNTLAYWARSYVMKKIKCSKYSIWFSYCFLVPVRISWEKKVWYSDGAVTFSIVTLSITP
jgi:hypothetical protein